MNIAREISEFGIRRRKQKCPPHSDENTEDENKPVVPPQFTDTSR